MFYTARTRSHGGHRRQLKPRTLTRDERWLVATFGKGVKGESAHICLLQTEGQQLLGLWDGDQEQWHACEPNVM